MNRSPQHTRGELLPARLWQAALTYPQRWIFRIGGISLLITLAGIGCLASKFPLWRPFLGVIAMCQIGYISIVITGHLKEQLDDWRSSIMPDFRLPHLTVATVMLASVVLGSSLSLHEPLAIGAAPLLAGVMVLSAVFAWMIYDPLLVLICSAIVGTVMAFTLKLDVAINSRSIFSMYSPGAL